MKIICTDGYILTADWHAAQSPSRGCAVVSPATGIGRAYYSAFAAFLTHHGWDVITFDNRGLGDSAHSAAKQSQARMRDWGQLDIEAALQAACASQEGDWQRVALIGHSSGGHLAGLAPSLQHVPQLVLIASGTCNWRLYPLLQKPRLLAAWWLVAPVLLSLCGYLPARFGVGVDLPPGVAWDWRNWSIGQDYLFSDAALDTSGYANYLGSVLALSFADDQGFAPPRTVNDLLRRFSCAQVSLEHITPGTGNTAKRLGHFGFFKVENASLWEDILADKLLGIRTKKAISSHKPSPPASQQ